MKLFSSVLFLVLCGFWIASVEKKEIPSTSTDVTTLCLPSFAHKAYFQINSNTSWDLTSLPAWIEASPVSGSGDATIELMVTGNDRPSSRNANLLLKSPGTGLAPVSIEIIQDKMPVMINLASQTIDGK